MTLEYERGCVPHVLDLIVSHHDRHAQIFRPHTGPIPLVGAVYSTLNKY
jgi:hypothetical protein